MPQNKQVQRNIASLPVELLLNVLDQLVQTRDGRKPIAFAPSDPVAKTLRTLTLVSRNVNRLASRYLYAHCVYLDNDIKYMLFRRTISLERHEIERNNDLSIESDKLLHVTSMFVSPRMTARSGNAASSRICQVADLGRLVGATLKRLVLDTLPVEGQDLQQFGSYTPKTNIFLQMHSLEELVCGWDVTYFYPQPPPNLKRLALLLHVTEDVLLDFCFATSSLEMLVFSRPDHLNAAEIDELFERYTGCHLDLVWAATNGNHVTPRNTRDWKEEDKVTMWEVDVPTSFYGDEEETALVGGWMWHHGAKGTLWDQDKRRMLCWSDVEKMLAEE